MRYINHTNNYKIDRNYYVHSGSWFGLPDFGVTEAIGGFIRRSPTYQGGSNIFGGYPKQNAQEINNSPQQSGPGGAYPIAGGRPTANNIISSSSNINNTPDPYQQARDEAAREAQRRENETRNYINSGYDDYASGLSGLEGKYNNQQNDELASNDKVYEQIFGGLNDQKKASLERLDTNRGVVRDRQNSAITGLKENLGQMIRNTSMQLGGMGAGDTSASQVMMPYAYTKIAGQEEGGIRKQANDQLFQIDQQEKDTVDKHMELWRQTEIDKENAKQNNKLPRAYAHGINLIQA